MAKHIATGKLGEQLAADYLRRKGYEIIHLNWRHERAEIDIIAQTPGDTTVFVEVKTRRSHRLGYPEESVTPTKQRLLSRAASAYIEIQQITGNVRFDVIAVTLYPDETEIYHIEDAFFGYSDSNV